MGADNVLALFKASRKVTTLDQTLIAMHNAFGSPESSREANSRDNTGVLAQPLPGSNDIGAHNRLFHIMHKTSNDNLTGSALAELASIFISNLAAELNTLDIGEEEWTDVSDFYAVVQKIVFNASTKALFGTYIFEIHPEITTEFWDAIRGRDRILGTLKQWHVAAHEHCDLNIEENQKAEREPYFGSKLVRDRLRGFSKIDGYEATALAAADLGLLWASVVPSPQSRKRILTVTVFRANANIVPIVGCTLLDTLARPSLLASVRSEIQACYSPSTSTSTSNLDMPTLLANPLLQSIYSEELRLRGATSLSRAPTHDLKIGDYIFPKDKVILVSGWHEQRDRSIWNEGPVNGTFHSVEEFWAERFIVHPENPFSGPRKPSSPPVSTRAKKVKEGEEQKSYYTTKPVEGSYVPYGVGLKICKGRFYAKQEALGSLALFLMMFDVEFVHAGPEGVPEPNMRVSISTSFYPAISAGLYLLVSISYRCVIGVASASTSVPGFTGSKAPLYACPGPPFCPIAGDFLFRLKNQNAPKAARITTSPAIPPPIPAFAPLDSPLEGVFVPVFVGAEPEVVGPVPDPVLCAEEEEEEEVVEAAKLYPSTGTAIMSASSVKVVVAEVKEFVAGEA
ncbi:cytochrome P450 [Hyaloscypha variabilis F]|uniref:Cytochrome P450 n=1 Tax=Hyaloscypha variabilis (strain UAMH 11265 / GT02V1 / F) TaxID=1149755 RepID=A0A2J6R3D1_HYAVF|nr:cytochrome P450 [Hyaloscypha variabilis F]